MWSGVAAGLALLTLSLARPAHAQSSSSVNDQDLLYEGQGWETASAPQECTAISQTTHYTNTSGDSVSYSFTGNAVYVHGPATYGAGSNPVTFFLDGIVQPPPLITQDDSGCGVLYANSNISDDGAQHNLRMVYTQPSGSSTFSLSGVTTTGLDNTLSMVLAVPTTTLNSATADTATQVPPGLQANPDIPLPTFSTSPTAEKPSVAQGPLFSSINPTEGRTGPTAGFAFSSTSSAAGADNTSSPMDGITSFATTHGMTIGVIGAIVGTVVGMVALLVLFVLIRRRITRQTAQKFDQQNGFGRDRDVEKGKGKPIALVDSGLPPVWGAGAKSDASFIVSPDMQQRATSRTASPASPPIAVAGVTRLDTRSAMSPISPARSLLSSQSRSPSTTYAVNLVPTPIPPSPDERPKLPILMIPQPHSGHHSSPPGLQTASSSRPTPFSSAAATWGDEKQAQSAYVVNRVDSPGFNSMRTGSSSGHPPPGYF